MCFCVNWRGPEAESLACALDARFCFLAAVSNILSVCFGILRYLLSSSFEAISDQFRGHIGPVLRPYRTTLEIPGNGAAASTSIAVVIDNVVAAIIVPWCNYGFIILPGVNLSLQRDKHRNNYPSQLYYRI